MPFPTWKQWFNSLPENERGNMDMTLYAEAWSQERTEEQLIRTLSADVNTVLLAADATNNVQVLHSFKNFGGTILRPQNIF